MPPTGIANAADSFVQVFCQVAVRVIGIIRPRSVPILEIAIPVILGNAIGYGCQPVAISSVSVSQFIYGCGSGYIACRKTRPHQAFAFNIAVLVIT